MAAALAVVVPVVVVFAQSRVVVALLLGVLPLVLAQVY
jgi:hypothetical protein